MSTLYEAEIRQVERRRVTVLLWIAHPDVNEFPETKAFALRLLWEASARSGGALAAAVALDDVFDDTSVDGIAPTYVTASARVATRNWRPDVDLGGADPSFWRNRDGLPRATYEITVSDERWVEGLRPGGTWESHAW